MNKPLAPDVQALIAARMATGRFEDENDLLRAALESLQDYDDDWLAVKQAIDDMEQGDEGLSLDETFAAIRAKYGIVSDGSL